MKKRKAMVVPVLLAMVLCLGFYTISFADTAEASVEVRTYDELVEALADPNVDEILFPEWDIIELRETLEITRSIKFTHEIGVFGIYAPWSGPHFTINGDDITLELNKIFLLDYGFDGQGGIVSESNNNLVIKNINWRNANSQKLRFIDSTVELQECFFGQAYQEFSEPIIYLENSSLMLNLVEITEAEIVSVGGAIQAVGDSSIEMMDGYLHNNTTTGNGGAISLLGNSKLVLGGNKNLISANEAANGGSIYAGGDSVIIFEPDSGVTDSKAEYGGGIYLADNAQLIMEDYTYITGNEALYGGGVYLADESQLTLNFEYVPSPPLIELNRAEYRGGGIYVSENATIIGKYDLIDMNEAPEGSNVYFGGEEPTEPTIVNDNNSLIQYIGNWTYYQDPAFYEGDEHFSNTPGDSVDVWFYGTGIEVVGAFSDNLGYAHFYLDSDVNLTETNLYTPSLEAQQIMFSELALENDLHHLKIIVAGSKDGRASDCYVTIDALKIHGVITEAPIEPVPPEEEFNDDHPSIVYSGNWTYLKDPVFFGGSQHFSNTPGDYVEFTFEGNQIMWVGAISDNLGIANVYIDDVFMTTMDQYYPRLVPIYSMFLKDLPSGIHTIRIEVTANKNQNATDNYTTIGGFYVRHDDY